MKYKTATIDEKREWNEDIRNVFIAAQDSFGADVSIKRDTGKWCWIGIDGLAVGHCHRPSLTITKYESPREILPAGGWIPANEILPE